MEERITELELRYMQQEHAIEELNEAVYRQEQTIMRLERELVVLGQQMRVLASPNKSAEEEQPPPHY